MELVQVCELNYNELRSEPIDYFIATCGHQPRCYHLAQKLESVCSAKLLLTIDEPDFNQSRCRHLEIFNKAGFKSFKASVTDSDGVETMMAEICNKPLKNLNILIDYSCMPKNWYSAIIDNITRNNFGSKKINLYLSYTPKIINKDSKPIPTEYFGPILNAKDQLNEKRPVAMIASLDSNVHWITQAIKQVKPQKLMTFIPECNYDPEFTDSVLCNNKVLLDKLKTQDIIHYQVTHPEQINTSLTSICLDQRVHSEVMIVPQGPKIFSMMALLISVRYPDIKLWEVIGKKSNSSVDPGLAAAIPVIIKVSFLDDDTEEED